MSYSFGTQDTITNISRSTTADGDALNDKVVLPLSSRDATILSDVNTTYDIADDVITTVNAYSASWLISKVSGFSAISVSSTYDGTKTKLTGASKFSKELEITTKPDNLFTAYPSDNTIVFSAKDLAADSSFSSNYKFFKQAHSNGLSVPDSVALPILNYDKGTNTVSDHSFRYGNEFKTDASVTVSSVKCQLDGPCYAANYNALQQSISMIPVSVTTSSLGLMHNGEYPYLRSYTVTFHTEDVVTKEDASSTTVSDEVFCTINADFSKGDIMIIPHNAALISKSASFIVVDPPPDLKTQLYDAFAEDKSKMVIDVDLTKPYDMGTLLRYEYPISVKTNSKTLKLKVYNTETPVAKPYSQSEHYYPLTVATVMLPSTISNKSISIKGWNIATNCSLGHRFSNATVSSMALFESSADNSSIAIYNSSASKSAFAHDYSTASDASIACITGYATMSSFASYNCLAENKSIAVLTAEAKNSSIAMLYDGVQKPLAYNYSIAIKGSKACATYDTQRMYNVALLTSHNYGRSYDFVAVSSESLNDWCYDVVFSKTSYGNNDANYTKCLAAVYSEAEYGGLALTNSTAWHSASAAVSITNSLAEHYCAESIAICNASAKGGSNHALAMVNSIAEATSPSAISLVDSTCTGIGTLALAAVNSTAADGSISAVALVNSITHHTSNGSIAIINSTAKGCGVSIINSDNLQKIGDSFRSITIDSEMTYGSSSLNWRYKSTADYGFYADANGVVNGVTIKNVAGSTISKSDMKTRTLYLAKL